MIRKPFSLFIIISVIFIQSTICSFAATININARTNDAANPVVSFFTAGEYDVIPIGKADGGLYNAWNAWGLFLPYWFNNYSISSDEFTVAIGDFSILYPTDISALDHAEATHFTLSTNALVNFYINDTPISDNIGGISLQVNFVPTTASAVPIPSAIWLFSAGIISLLSVSRKRKPIQ